MNRAFELLVLGSSSASPTSDRNVSGQLLNIANRYFLIDCGEGTQMQLRRYKARFQSIDHILISHLHGDHFFGLPGLLSSMHLLGRKQDLHIYGPPLLEGLMHHINQASDTTLNYKIVWHATNNKDKNLLFEDDKLTVHSFPMQHRVFCTGFLFTEKPRPRSIDRYKLEQAGLSVADIPALKKGLDATNASGVLVKNNDVTIAPPPPRAYAYCSDTVFDPKLVDYVKGVDLLYHESTFLDEHQQRAAKTLHSTAAQAGEIAAMAGVGKLLLGHFSARYHNLDEFLKEAGARFQNCLLATDGKIVKI